MAKNQTNSKTGRKLIRARRQKRLHRDELAEKLGVDVSVLKSLDEWNFDDLENLNEPLPVTARRYAKLLDLSPQEFIDSLPEQFTRTKGGKTTKRLFVFSRISVLIMAGTVVFSLVAFLGWRTFSANAIPQLDILHPTQNITIDSSQVEIRGSTNEGSQVYVNGVAAPVEIDGTFKTGVVLQPGPNTIEIRAINSFARERTIYRTVIRN